MKNSYTAVVKDGRLILDESTDLPNGTKISLIEESPSFQSLTQQIENKEQNTNNDDLKLVTSDLPKEITPTSDFSQFDLHALVMQAIQKVGYSTPTLIQNQAIQPILDKKDVLGIAKTGSGKTAAFALPIINNLLENNIPKKQKPSVLIITPTRELALQIGVSFDTYARFTNLRQITIFGGVSQQPQVKQLKNEGGSILVATPGRLLDLMGQGHVNLDQINTLVLDEADRMLDMGFIPDIKRILRNIPKTRQSLLFSATMPPEILDLSKSFLKDDFIHVTGDQQSIPINKIRQEIYFVEKEDKLSLLLELLSELHIPRALVFTRTKYGADKLVRKLKKQSFSIEAMHGNKSQQARQRVLRSFKENQLQILVATDLAARGLDVNDISHVVNYDLPREAETYMHRIGRTARAGKSGIAISFCAHDEKKYFTQIEQLLGIHIPRAQENPFQSKHEEPFPTDFKKYRRKKTKKSSSSNQRSNSRKRKYRKTGKEKEKTMSKRKPRKKRISKNSKLSH